MQQDLPPLSAEEALELTQRGGTLLCLDVPSGVEFGIDLRSYTVGPRFGGVKMVPTAGLLHLVTCGSELEQCGVFLHLKPASTCAARWDASSETLRLIEAGTELTQLHGAVQRMEFDEKLGPYPLATEEQWRGLSCYISEDVLRRAGVPLGTFIVPGGIDDDEPSEGISSADRMQPFFDGLPRVATFVTLDPRRHPRGRQLNGAALSALHLDKSEWLGDLLAAEYTTNEEAPRELAEKALTAELAENALIGELQLAFLLFLRLSSLRSLEHWKRGVHLLCGCERALLDRPRLFCRFLALLRAQLALAPADFFEDELSADNFLRRAFAELLERTEGQPLAPSLVSELRRLWRLLEAQFGLTLDSLRTGTMDEEDEPVVVSI